MARATIYNKITNKSDIDLISDNNKQLRDDYLEYLRSVQRAETTIVQYSHDLNIFFVWNLKHNNNCDFTKITKRNIVSYQNWLLNNNHNSPARIRRLKSTLSSLSNYIENILDDEFKNYRPIIKKVENPVNQAVREKTVFTDEQLYGLLDNLVQNKEYEKACALALGMFSGRRKSELARFKVSYFQKSCLVCKNVWYRTPEKICTKGKGKGKFINCYVMAKKFQPYLNLWLKDRKQKNIKSEWLLCDEKDCTKPISISKLNTFANHFSKSLNEDFYWHSLRHYFTTYLSKIGLSNNAIKTIIGWESVAMCDIYNDTSSEEILESYFDENGNVIADSTKANNL